MPRIRTTKQAAEIREIVLRRKRDSRWAHEFAQNLAETQRLHRELREEMRAASRAEIMKKFRHRRPTSL